MADADPHTPPLAWIAQTRINIGKNRYGMRFDRVKCGVERRVKLRWWERESGG